MTGERNSKQGTREVEVEGKAYAPWLIIVHQDVRRLHIAVNDAMCVEVGQRVKNFT